MICKDGQTIRQAGRIKRELLKLIEERINESEARRETQRGH